MTNKINDMDVSEWELKGVLIPIMECKYFEGIGDCKESKGLCVANDNCYFKQLKRLQKENEELRQVRKNFPDIQEPYVYLYRQIKKQCHKLEEENEKLKEKVKSEKYIKENALQEATKYSMKCGEFRQALEEIRNEIGDLKDINKLFYRLGKAEGRCLRFKIALEKVKNLVSGSYEMLDPQAKVEIQRIVEEALNV